MKKSTSYLLLGGLSLLLSACVSQPVKPDASAELQARSGSRASASARFTDTGEDKLRIEVTARNLTPGEHGIHLHELGDCSAPDASSARGHYNPLGKRHGHYDKPEHHVGDLPNLLADGKGNANYSTEVQGLLLKGVIGLSLIITADPDDYMSHPEGNSGKRIACGVVR